MWPVHRSTSPGSSGMLSTAAVGVTAMHKVILLSVPTLAYVSDKSARCSLAFPIICLIHTARLFGSDGERPVLFTCVWLNCLLSMPGLICVRIIICMLFRRTFGWIKNRNFPSGAPTFQCFSRKVVVAEHDPYCCCRVCTRQERRDTHRL